MACSADHQPQGGFEHLDERASVTDGSDGGPTLRQRAGGGRRRLGVDRRPAQRSLDRAVGPHQHAPAGRGSVDAGDHRQGPSLSECGSQRAGDLARAIRGFDEHVDRPVAPEPQPPHLVVVMSHNVIRDAGFLRAALRTPARGISMLGPSGRTRRLIDDLRTEGVAVSDADLARIHGPAGLDVGAEGPEEIATAIVAEVVALRRGRAGGFLRERGGPIHDR